MNLCALMIHGAVICSLANPGAAKKGDLPDSMQALIGEAPVGSGPNCWNAALGTVFGVPPRYVTPNEWKMYLGHCNQSKSPKSGDLGAVRTALGDQEIHGFTFLSPSLIFYKHSVFHTYPWVLGPPEESLREYGVNLAKTKCINPTGKLKQICGNYIDFFSCKPGRVTPLTDLEMRISNATLYGRYANLPDLTDEPDFKTLPTVVQESLNIQMAQLQFEKTYNDLESIRLTREQLNSRDTLGQGLFHYAVNRNDLKKVKLLLDLGADPNLENATGWAPAFIAALQGQTDLLRLLAPALNQQGHNLDAPGSHGWTLMGLAASNGHLSTVKALYEAGASPHALSMGTTTPLQAAAHKGHDHVVEYLEDLGEL